MARRALITGVAGFIGSHLADRLLAEGYEVDGIDSFEPYYERAVKESNVAQAMTNQGFKLIEADIVKMAAPGAPGLLADLVARADEVYHLAAQPGVRGSWGALFDTYARNNVLATQLVLDTCLREGVDKLVFGSSSSVYGDTEALPMREDAACWPHSPYGVTKLAAEHLCRLYSRNFGLPTVALRFFTVYGPRQRPDMAFHRFARAMLIGEPVALFGDGGQTRDFTYISDIVDGILAARTAPDGEVFNLGGGSRVTLTEAVETLAAAVGVEPAIERGPAQPGDVHDTFASLEKSRAVIAYEPKVSLTEGLRSEVEWLREHIVV